MGKCQHLSNIFSFVFFELHQDMPSTLRFTDLLTVLFKFGFEHKFFLSGHFFDKTLNNVIAELMFGQAD